MRLLLISISALAAMGFLSSCSSTPKINENAVTVREAEAWLQKYCSQYDLNQGVYRELTGDLVMRSSTREFKGQYPASIHYAKNGGFQMEVTNIIGGTMMRLTGTRKSIELLVPPKPKYNRKSIQSYMGLDLPILAQLLRGDLPCPSEKTSPTVDGVSIVVQTPTWKWVFDRATETDGLIPVRVRLVAPEQTIEMTIENWDTAKSFAKKVQLKTLDGELKWTWRSRDVE